LEELQLGSFNLFGMEEANNNMEKWGWKLFFYLKKKRKLAKR